MLPLMDPLLIVSEPLASIRVVGAPSGKEHGCSGCRCGVIGSVVGAIAAVVIVAVVGHDVPWWCRVS